MVLASRLQSAATVVTVAALSGSVCLLHLLCRLRRCLTPCLRTIKNLIVVLLWWSGAVLAMGYCHGAGALLDARSAMIKLPAFIELAADQQAHADADAVARADRRSSGTLGAKDATAAMDVSRPSRFLRLGDIAELSSTDLPVLATLMALPLPWPQPSAANGVLRLERADLQQRILSQPALAAVRLTWQGAATVEIAFADSRYAQPVQQARRGALPMVPMMPRVQTMPTPSGPIRRQEIRGETLVGLTRSALQQWLLTQGLSASVEVLDTPANVFLPEGRLSLFLRSLPTVPLRERLNVWVDMHVERQWQRSVPVRVLLAMRDHGRGNAQGAAVRPTNVLASLSRQEYSAEAAEDETWPAQYGSLVSAQDKQFPASYLATASSTMPTLENPDVDTDNKRNDSKNSFAAVSTHVAHMTAASPSPSPSSSSFSSLHTSTPSPTSASISEPLPTSAQVEVPAPDSTTTAVRRGKAAQLAASSGAVSVSGTVEVLQDGRIGQTVRVKRSGEGKAFNARVLGPAMVAVP